MLLVDCHDSIVGALQAARVQHAGRIDLRDGIQYRGAADSSGFRVSDGPFQDVFLLHVNFVNGAGSGPCTGSDVITFKRRTRSA